MTIKRRIPRHHLPQPTKLPKIEETIAQESKPEPLEDFKNVTTEPSPKIFDGEPLKIPKEEPIGEEEKPAFIDFGSNTNSKNEQPSSSFASEDWLKKVKEEEPDFEEYKPLEGYPQPISNGNPQEEVVKRETHDPMCPERSESKSTQPQSSSGVRIWRPKIQSLTDLFMEEESDSDELSHLGSSILFKKAAREKEMETRESSPEGDDQNGPEDIESGNSETKAKRALPLSVVRQEINAFFAKNRHPKAAEMLAVAERLFIRYRTVYEMMEKRRHAAKVKCPAGDPCTRIKQFFERENDLLRNMKLDNETRNILHDDIETHILSRKRFSLGYVHIIMEKTNLPPAYIRGQYETWKKKLLTQDRDDYTVGEYKKEIHETPLSIETLRSLENAYLAKKYHCTQKHWTQKEIEDLSAELKIPEKKVAQWIEKRQTTQLGLDDDVIQFRRVKDEKKKKRVSQKIPSWKLSAVEEAFSKNKDMTVPERCQLAARLELTDKQVQGCIKRQRIMAKKRMMRLKLENS